MTENMTVQVVRETHGGELWTNKRFAEKNDDLTKPNTDLELCGL